MGSKLSSPAVSAAGVVRLKGVPQPTLFPLTRSDLRRARRYDVGSCRRGVSLGPGPSVASAARWLPTTRSCPQFPACDSRWSNRLYD